MEKELKLDTVREELQRKKILLEKRIAGAILEFEKETGFEVKSIRKNSNEKWYTVLDTSDFE